MTGVQTCALPIYLLSEVQQTVDRVVIISHGRLAFQGTLDALETGTRVHVDADDRGGLARALEAAGGAVELSDDGLHVASLDAGAIGRQALAAGIPLTLLAPEREGLENVFLGLVGEGEVL